MKSSNEMELSSAKACFAFLKQAGLKIGTFISDRHKSIAQWIREEEPDTKHYYDIWHIAKSVTKKLLKAGKESGCEVILKWQKSIKNHLHWCATSTFPGFGAFIVAKWKLLVRHLRNKHKEHPDPLFQERSHVHALSSRQWFKVG